MLYNRKWHVDVHFWVLGHFVSLTKRDCALSACLEQLCKCFCCEQWCKAGRTDTTLDATPLPGVRCHFPNLTSSCTSGCQVPLCHFPRLAYPCDPLADAPRGPHETSMIDIILPTNVILEQPLFLYLVQNRWIHWTHPQCIAWHNEVFSVSTGALPEDHWEERISGPAVGSLHHPERRYVFCLSSCFYSIAGIWQHLSNALKYDGTWVCERRGDIFLWKEDVLDRSVQRWWNHSNIRNTGAVCWFSKCFRWDAVTNRFVELNVGRLIRSVL